MAYKPQHRKDFVLGKSHLFIQQPDEWITDLFELGQEIRPFPDAAYDFDNSIYVPVESAPDFMDQISDYNVLPRYTDLLEKVQKLQDLVDSYEANPREATGNVYFDGFGDGFRTVINVIKQTLKGE